MQVTARFCASLSAVALLAASCGGDGPRPSNGGESPTGARSFNQAFGDAEFYPVIASSEVVVGRNRFLVGLLNAEDAPVAKPEIEMHIEFFDLEKSAEEPAGETAMRFIWIDRPYQGIYVGEAMFDEPGKWGAEVSIHGATANETLRTSFDVRAESASPGIGEAAPAIDTPTATDVNGRLPKISTDPRPDPRFYRLSIADALEAGRPFVVAFATPKFCVSQTCGPTLDIVKQAATRFPEVNFLHVEPYELPADPSRLEPVRSVTRWGLPSEPFVFVVDGAGKVAAKFEGALSVAELSRVLSQV